MPTTVFSAKNLAGQKEQWLLRLLPQCVSSVPSGRVCSRSLATGAPISHPLTVSPPRYHTPSLSRPLVITPPSCGAPVHGAYHRGRARYHTPPIKASPVMMCFKGQKVYRRSVLFTRVMRVRCSRCTKFGWVRKRIIVVLHADECHHPNAKPNPPTNKSAKNGPKRWFQPLFFCSWTGVALVYL